MSNQVLSRKHQLLLFTGVATLLEELCWKPTREAKRTWIPKSKNTLDQEAKASQRGKTRIEMEKACSYIVRAEIGEGLNHKKVEQCFAIIKNWKKYFVQFMASKVDLQKAELCQTRIRLAIRAGKKLECKHTDKHVLGTPGAAALADSIFMMFYDNEVRALKESGISPYFGRDAGPVEFGESMSDPSHMPRQFAEIPTGPEYSSREDEHASAWTMSDWSELNENNDDEYVETENGRELVIDFNSRNEIYGDLRRDLMHCKDQTARDKVLKHAENLVKLDRISNYQFNGLKYFSFQVLSYRIKEYRGELEDQNV
jgi:hypothetical protein